MSLESVLQRSDFVNLSDADALAYGNETVVVLEDHTPYTWSGIGQKLLQHGVSAEQVIGMATNINSLPGGALLNACLTSGGMDFADATNRAIISSFEVNEPDWAVAVLEGMLAIGQTHGTRWELFGVSQPTLQDITDARADIADRAQKTAFSALCRMIADRLDAGQIDTVQAAKEALAAG